MHSKAIDRGPNSERFVNAAVRTQDSLAMKKGLPPVGRKPFEMRYGESLSSDTARA